MRPRRLPCSLAWMAVMPVLAGCPGDAPPNQPVVSDGAASSTDVGGGVTGEVTGASTTPTTHGDATAASDATTPTDSDDPTDSGDPTVGACSPGGEACETFDTCCSGVCAQQVCTACAGEDAACGEGAACCVGLACSADGVCRGCAEPGEGCDAATPCCGGEECIDGGCGGCASDAAPCVFASECCSNICAQGTCAPCGAPGDACDDEADCCGALDLPCTDGRCCIPPAAHGCEHDEDCCSGVCDGLLERFGGITTCCEREGGPCEDDSQCCGGACMPDGTCGCTWLQDACSSHLACCDPDVFAGNGACVSGVCCAMPNESCSSDDDCCVIEGVTLACLGGSCGVAR